MRIVPEAFQDLLSDTSPNTFAVLATVTPGGQPVTMPVWFLADQDAILFSSEVDSLKARNIRANPSVSLCIMREDNHVRYLEIRGRVVDITTDGWGEYSRRQKAKYPGADEPGESAPPGYAMFRVLPEKVLAFDYT